MASAADRDEQDAQDPFARTAPADRGYRVGVRIARPRDRRPQLAVAALGVAVGGAIVVAAFRLQVPEPAARSTLPPAASGLVRPIATRLPALYQPVDLAKAIPPLPVLSGGLRWLDPGAGVVSGPPFSGARGWIFAGSDGGAWCVCYDSPWSPTGTIERTTIARYRPDGSQYGSRTVVGEITSSFRSSDAIERDVARSADGRFVFVAAAIREEAGWTVRLDQVALDPAPRQVESLDLGRVDLSPGGTILFAPVVKVAPDGRHVRVGIQALQRGRLGNGPPTDESVWIVGTRDDGVITGVDETSSSQGPATSNDCAESWVTPTIYARLCAEQIGNSLVPMAHLQPLAGPETAIQVGGPVGAQDLDWLVDARIGVVYRWSRFSHILAKLDVVTGQVTERGLGPTLTAFTPEAARPGPQPGRAIWAPLISAAEVGQAHLAGSIDGSLLFAIGSRGGAGTGPSGPLFASTGIFVFDATTLALVDHWPAAASYDQVGASADGRFVLAVGTAGMTADGSLADWPPSLAIHDAGSGELVEQLSQLAGDEGFFVDLLVPGPAP